MTALPPYLRLMRPNQWIKNGIILAPILFSGNLFTPGKLADALMVTLLFCLMSSAIYVFNDYQDMEIDRHHATKRHRPLASGEVSVAEAWALALALILAAIGGVLLVPGIPNRILVIFSVYAVINLLYSSIIKTVPIVELFMVASGFVLRLLAGGIVIAVPISGWMLACTGLIALMLVAGKRRADLAHEGEHAGRPKVLEHYSVRFLDAVIVMLAGATIVAYLIFCVSEYGQEQFGAWVQLTAVFVTMGLMRFVQIVIMERGGEDPTRLIVTDRIILRTLVVWILSFMAIIYWPS